MNHPDCNGRRAGPAPLRLTAWLVATLMLLPSGGAQADEDAEIVMGCHFSIGEFGYEAVDMCVRAQKAARDEVRQLPAELRGVATGCKRRLEPDWVMVKRCIEAEIAAVSALEGYVRDHGPMVDRCRELFGMRGDHRVRICVEQAIAAEQAEAHQPSHGKE